MLDCVRPGAVVDANRRIVALRADDNRDRPRFETTERCAHELVPTHRRVRVPLGLRGEHARRARRRRRVAVPPASRLAQCLRRAPRPVGRILPIRAVERRRPQSSAVRAGHERARDHVAHAERLDDRVRPPGHGSHRGTTNAARTGGGHRATRRRRERCCGSRRASAAASRCRPTACRCSTTAARWRRGSTTRPGTRTSTVQRGDLSLRLASSLRLGTLGARVYARTALEEGETAWIALSWGGPVPGSGDEAYEQLRQTEKYWRDWLGAAEIPDHPWRPYIERSALALKGLSYAPTGAIMAAGTTSLPETLGGERNWDYRFTWIRDTAFMLRALHALGFEWEAFEYFAFVLEAVSGAARDGDWHLQIMYGIGGETDLTEHTLDHLSGYRNSRPVRIGNGAYDQQQHDVWGMLLDSLAIHSGATVRSPPRSGRRSPGSSTRPSNGTPSPIRASGRCAGIRSTSSPPRSCAGSPPTGAAGWRTTATTRSAPIDGEPPPMPSRPRCWRRASTSGACSSSTTTRRSSTRPTCSFRSWASCHPTTNASAPPSWPSPTSSPRMVSSCATGSTPPTTASRTTPKARSPSARSGWCRRSP